MTPQDQLEHYEATEAQDLIHLLRALRPPERAVQVPTHVDIKIRAELWKAQALRQMITLLPMARLELIQVIQQALMENPMLEEAARTEEGDAPADADHAPRLMESADDLTEGQALYDSIWQECVPGGWDAHGLPAQASEAPCTSEHTISPPRAIVADVIVTKVGQEYQVVLNEEGIPRLRLSQTSWRLRREDHLGPSEATPYVEEKLRAAVWLIRSLEHRRRALDKVAQSLVTWQRAFLDHGLAHLKPLALTDVADAIGMHASTVSRVIANKYLSMAYGIVALTSFFPSGLEFSGGKARSSLTVHETQQLIAAEAGPRPQPAWQLGSRLSPDEEQRVSQVLEAPARLPYMQAWLQSRQSPGFPSVDDPAGEVRAAYRDLQRALAHPQLCPAVLLALRAFAQAAQVGATPPPPADPVVPMAPLQEWPAGQAHRRQGHSWIGESPKMREVSRLIERAQQTTVSVLITGERGTGKEWLARLIHAQGPRREGPFIVVRCAAISEAQLEAELFGEEPAAVTGARQHQYGCFELAAGGTLFLDEIAELSPALQAKLLRILQEQRFERVGGTETVTTHARIIAATTQDLEELMADGTFRRDLFYRLNGYSIPLPPLRERREDILPLASHVLRRWCGEQGKAVMELSEDATALLLGYHWPGNVRELEEVIEQAVARCQGPTVTAQDLPQALREQSRAPVWSGEAIKLPFGGIGSVELEERQLLRQALEQAHGNMSQAAKLLGLSRTQLRTRLKHYGLEAD